MYVKFIYLKETESEDESPKQFEASFRSDTIIKAEDVNKLEAVINEIYHPDYKHAKTMINTNA